MASTSEAMSLLGKHYGGADDMLKAAWDSIQGYLGDWNESGKKANALTTGLLTGSYDPTEYLMKYPGYQWTKEQGIKSLDQSAASRGQLLSGQQVKGAEQYGQNLATSVFDKWLSNLFGLSNQGLTSGNALSNYAMNIAKARGDNTIGAGNALASGIMREGSEDSGFGLEDALGLVGTGLGFALTPASTFTNSLLGKGIQYLSSYGK